MVLVPLFVCHANCCRSVMARYLYEHLSGGLPALSAGVEVGEQINDRAESMLRLWGIDASDHRPRRIDRALAERADAIFAMSPEQLARLLDACGRDLASKAYLFADPFSVPQGFGAGKYQVYDPSFENRPIEVVAREFEWFRERVVEIREALSSRPPTLVPALRYAHLLDEGRGTTAMRG